MRWHLSRTRVTAAGLLLLSALPALDFVDARGTGVPRASLLPLERRFALLQPQGAVLARGSALAAAAVGGALFLCCCPAGGVALAEGAALHEQGQGPGGAGAGAGRACGDAAAWQGAGRGAGAGVVRAARPVVGLRRRLAQEAGGAGAASGADDDDATALRGIVALLCA